MGPLAGIKVLDLSRILAGPWATQCLADFGATVWKIEKPGSGDDTRHWGPPWVRDGKGKDTRESAYFASTNRGKHSLALDFTKPAGQQLVRSLAMRADVLIENFKVGKLAKYRLGYESLKRVNPKLVYCSISAFGQDGPASQEPGYDAMIQALSGLMSVTGVPDGEPGAGPVKVGVAVSDLITGMYAAVAILAALNERERSGRGEYIDLALLDSQVAALANQTLNYLVTGKSPIRRGTAHPNIVPYQAFPTKDAWLMLAVGNDRQFQSFCKAAGRLALARDSRFKTNAARVKNRATLVPALERLCRKKTTKEWVKILTPASVPCGPINSIAEVFAEPQVKHRGLRFELPHALGGKLPQVKNPVFFSRNTLVYSTPPPLLGADTERVLASELGLTKGEILSLKRDGTIG
ncbi:MAG TPA: CaiB/BaiF CoA-transferase family protein [Steroidobacteraceae bacterium]|nr:CaiB/BaiF CoA-transferase family protein [Steroidobacteraceae bacterium]